ncbi:Aldo/keto reductase [Macrolepiota fuliginosa MF-IS2]|uniref:Aldo/keto reductase n=1 Tax=Macrolepiota fuliginosa MF-IS2 TaxID=1400762 RepID=A0A9P6C2M4_9AGAR|nr:Aldo/keto reductase [Macrolepiota fuliginosa MF-IS2]
MSSAGSNAPRHELTFTSTTALRDGNNIPILGFGTYELDGVEAYQSVRWALEAGYRLIDSAEWYENEKEAGQAILDFCKETNTPRSEIFYTSKLKNNNGYASVKKCIERSVKECGLGYIDLYLMHSPIGGKNARQESWKAICDAQKEGIIRSVGISTFGTTHIQDILDLSAEYPTPVAHQIDLHPFMARTEIVEFSRKNGMVLEAWGPLVRGMRFNHHTLRSIATKHGKETAHILLRYSLQKGYVAIPKSARKDRIIANTQIFDFELTTEEIAQLDALDEALVTDWDPTTVQ